MLQVIANVGEVLPFAPSYKASGGNIMAHGTHTKVHLRKRGSIFKAKVVGSSAKHEPESHATLWFRSAQLKAVTFGIWDKVTVVPTVYKTVGLRSPDRSRPGQASAAGVVLRDHTCG